MINKKKCLLTVFLIALGFILILSLSSYFNTEDSSPFVSNRSLFSLIILMLIFIALLNSSVAFIRLYNSGGNSLKFAKENLPIVINSSKIAEGKFFDDDKLVVDKKYCHITFSDNGIGFDPRYNEKIFEVFQRLHGKAQYDGTGIGLSIVKKIVDNHEGVIYAKRELNKGTTFNIFIPAFPGSN